MSRRPVVALACGTSALLACSVLGALPAAAGPSPDGPREVITVEPVPDSYLVVLDDEAVASERPAALSAALAERYGGTVTATWQHALRGFAVRMSAEAAKAMAADDRVAHVEQDSYARVGDVQPNPPSWGLDRVDQRNLPLNAAYHYDTTASNVHAYVLDTGIRTTHATFGGRATWGVNTVDLIDTDCHGHGTHVAGTLGGAEYGVAKGVQLVAVKVLDCDGFGTVGGVISGVDWVTANAVRPAVANMSLGAPASTTLDNAVTNSIASGITYSAAAGNGVRGVATDACTVSPARAGAVITVSATGPDDGRPSWANYGICVDIFAPGADITSASAGSDTAALSMHGTSMASPHVSGAAALYLATHPAAWATEVQQAIVAAATPNVVANPGSGSPNRLLYTAPTQPGNCRGMTWSVRDKEWGRDLALVGADVHTDAYGGDTPCDRSLPVLCLRPQGLPVPPGITPGFTSGWTGGDLRLTAPVQGSTLTSRAAADTLCASHFGAGWRMGEHHDGGGGWGWWAYGDPVRMWVAIDDQLANPWNSTTGNAMTWTLKTHQWGDDVVDLVSDFKTNAYDGDTQVSTSLPVLCLRRDGRPAPPGVDPNDFNNGWSQGEARLTSPVRGWTLTSRAAADALCAAQFGPGYRMGEFHDGGGGWGWWAAGDLGRMWVAIDDQPANPWNPR